MAGLVVDGRDLIRDSAPSKRSRAEYDLQERGAEEVWIQKTSHLSSLTEHRAASKGRGQPLKQTPAAC